MSSASLGTASASQAFDCVHCMRADTSLAAIGKAIKCGARYEFVAADVFRSTCRPVDQRGGRDGGGDGGGDACVHALAWVYAYGRNTKTLHKLQGCMRALCSKLILILIIRIML